MPNPRGINQYSKGAGRGRPKTSTAKKPTVRKATSRKKKVPEFAPKNIQHSLGRDPKTGKPLGVRMVSLTDTAAGMYGYGSKQHLAAIKRFGK